VIPLRILHVDSGRTWRGGQAQVDLLVRGLAARGHVQGVASPRGAPLAARIAAGGAAGLMHFAPGSDGDLPAAIGLAQGARRFHPDIVHLHDARAHATGWIAARAANARCVVSRRVALAAEGRRPHAWKYVRLPVDRFHAISSAVKDELLALGVAPPRIVVVPDAVDVGGVAAAVAAARADGRAAALRAEWAGDAGGPLWGVIAALTPEKGHDVLLEALARAGEAAAGARVVVVGDGPERGALVARAAGLGLTGRLLWVGAIENVAAPMAVLDGLLVPSRAEGFGSIVLVAQAAGVPVVASAVGGLVEVLAAGRTGRLVPSGDADAWARALGELAGRPVEARRVADVARLAVADFDAPAIAARIEELYRGIAPT
jgi:glycosyltransferase involved in cell wall biosynthesis